MKFERFLLLPLAALSMLASGAEAKTFRHYYGMQWEWEPTTLESAVVAKKGDTMFQARLLPTRLFVIEDDFIVDGKLILPKGEQLAQAESSKLVRCSLGPAERASMADDRRICFWDSDGDKQLDAWFDEGLGMEFGQLQFTGCLPVEPVRATVPALSEIDPTATKWPFIATVQLDAIKAKKDKRSGTETYSYRLDFAIKRQDKPALQFTICGANGGCWVPPGQPGTLRDFMRFRVSAVDREHAAFELLEPIRRKGYYNMTAGNRPDPIYCPGTLFVETDQDDVW